MSENFCIFATQSTKIKRMKKLLITALVLAGLGTATAQTTKNTESTAKENAKLATQEGNYTVGINTTGLGFTSVDGVTNINTGVTIGAFAKDNLAVVATVGYQSNHQNDVDTNNWFYGAGLKYYVVSRIPLQVDWRGSIGNDFHPGQSFVGFQGGYAWFPFSNFSVEPTVRYELSTKTEYENRLVGGLGFNLFF